VFELYLYAPAGIAGDFRGRIKTKASDKIGARENAAANTAVFRGMFVRRLVPGELFCRHRA
jgi:hypothetical protein